VNAVLDAAGTSSFHPLWEGHGDSEQHTRDGQAENVDCVLPTSASVLFPSALAGIDRSQ
jgi:hypothetical protein